MAAHDFHHVLEAALEGRVRATPRRDQDKKVDEWLELLVGEDIWPLAIEHKASAGEPPGRLRAHQDGVRDHWPNVVPVLAVPRLSKRERQTLREHQINHMDLAGNVWIQSPGLFVKTEGARPPLTQRPGKGRNPFSKKASLVSRVLLAHPSAHWRVRSIAKEASLSVGYSSEVLRSLVERGYAVDEPGGFQLQDPVALLAEWAGAYRWEDNLIHSFVAPIEKNALLPRTCAVLQTAGVKCLLTLLSATDRIMAHVEHSQVHIYASQMTRDAEAALRSDLFAEAVQQGGNVHVLRPYYGEAVWYDAKLVNGLWSVSDVQLFLDLIHYPVRGPEAALALLKRYLGPRLELSAEHIRRLRHEVGI